MKSFVVNTKNLNEFFKIVFSLKMDLIIWTYIFVIIFQFRISVFCTIFKSEIGLFHFFESIFVWEKSPLAKVEVEKGEHDQAEPHEQNDGQFTVRSHLSPGKQKIQNETFFYFIFGRGPGGTFISFPSQGFEGAQTLHLHIVPVTCYL